MDKNAPLKNTIFSMLNTDKSEHLKPLSVYSRMVTCDQNSTLHHVRMFPDPFINLKIEVVNNCATKRKLDDSSREYNCETPAKKPFSPNALSPDVGCCMDYCIPLAKQDSVSPLSIFYSSLDKSQSLRSETEETTSSQLNSCMKDEECGSTTEPGGDEGTVPRTLKSVFDFDVDPQLSPTTSSPMLRIGGVKVAEDVCHLESSSDSGCHTQAVLCGPYITFTVSDPSVSGLPLESVNCPVEPLEGDIEEVWHIGLPIFESSMCHNVTVKLQAGSEQSSPTPEEVQEGVTEPLYKCQTTLSGEEVSPDSSYETTLPLQIQVKSVVVAPSQLTSSSKPLASPLPDQNTKPAKPNKSGVSQTARSLRPVIFNREADWEHEKSLYVYSVNRHINESSDAAQDVMSELLKLMTDVADQRPGTMGKQWQHPSDLTRRNYQRRFGNMAPKMALHEWQAKNYTTHKRFANVPKVFERSHFP